VREIGSLTGRRKKNPGHRGKTLGGSGKKRLGTGNGKIRKRNREKVEHNGIRNKTVNSQGSKEVKPTHQGLVEQGERVKPDPLKEILSRTVNLRTTKVVNRQTTTSTRRKKKGKKWRGSGGSQYGRRRQVAGTG